MLNANIVIVTIIYIVIDLGVNGLLHSLASILTGQELNLN